MRQNQLAKLLGVSVNTIQRWRREGLKFRPDGPMDVEIDLKDLEIWLLKRSDRHALWVDDLRRRGILARRN